MFSIMLLAISIVALSQFALYYWRAVLAGVAAQPVSDRVLITPSHTSGKIFSEWVRATPPAAFCPTGKKCIAALLH